MALICRKTYFWDGPELYQNTGFWDNLQKVANIRLESEADALSFMKYRARLTHVSSSPAKTAHTMVDY